MDHEYFMRKAIELGLKVPQFPFGAIIVKRDTGEFLLKGLISPHLIQLFMAKW